MGWAAPIRGAIYDAGDRDFARANGIRIVFIEEFAERGAGGYVSSPSTAPPREAPRPYPRPFRALLHFARCLTAAVRSTRAATARRPEALCSRAL